MTEKASTLDNPESATPAEGPPGAEATKLPAAEAAARPASVLEGGDKPADLADLLTSFDVFDLGHADTIVGCNLLAAMACTLANLAPDEGVMIEGQASPARVGTSLLVFGSGSSGRVVDEIVDEVCRKQNNLGEHLNRYLEKLREENSKQGYSFRSPPPREGNSHHLVSATQIEHSLDTCTGGAWQRLLSERPELTIRQIGKDPKVLASVGGSGDIGSRLKGLLPGCTLVHLGLAHTGDIARFADAAPALLDGRHPVGDGDRSVKGHILVTDPMHVLVSAAREADERTAWLGRLLWLTDGQTGPDAPRSRILYRRDATELFRGALEEVLAYRLAGSTVQPLRLSREPRMIHDLRLPMIRWTLFLRNMEPMLPGVSGACHNLLTSLCFGLVRMDLAGGAVHSKGSLTIGGIEAFARFLVRRMANARTAMLNAAELARRRDQISRVFHKLLKGPADGRKLCRDLKLPSAERDEALRWLQSAGLASAGRSCWELREGATLDFKNCALPVIEV